MEVIKMNKERAESILERLNGLVGTEFDKRYKENYIKAIQKTGDEYDSPKEPTKKMEMLQTQDIYEVGKNSVANIEVLEKQYPAVKIEFEDGSAIEISGDYELFESAEENEGFPPMFL